MKNLNIILILIVTFHLVAAKKETNLTDFNFKLFSPQEISQSDLSSPRTFNSSLVLNLKSFLVDYGRSLKSASTLSLINAGNLAMVGMVLLGGIALMSPIIFGDNKKREDNYINYPVISKKILDSLKDISLEAVPFIENEIMEAQQYYKRAKRGGDDRLSLHDFVSNRFMSISESIMVWVERTLDNIPHLPRLEAQACMKRIICEAHNQPKKYGLTGLVLQLFFPPYIESDTPSKIISKYQLAARYGRTENANCAVQYDDCIINFLDLIQSVTNLIL